MREYSEHDIEVLRGLEPIRRRPGMFIGSVGREGVRHLLLDVVNNTIDEHLAGHAHRLDISVNEAGVWRVGDDGRGIPFDAVVPLLTTLLASRCVDRRERGSADRFGLGMIVINALSESCVVTVERADEGRRQFRFVRGELVEPYEALEPTGQTGTEIRFRPDRTIFTDLSLHPSALRSHLVDLSGLNPGLRIVLQGETLEMPGGLISLAERRAGGPLQDVLVFEGDQDGVYVQGVLGWYTEGPAVVWSFSNQQETLEGGSHVTGATQALEDVPTEGRRLLLNVRLDQPLYAGQTRNRLTNEEVTPIVARIVRDALAREATKKV